jgi:predicted nucleic acid-binding protein
LAIINDERGRADHCVNLFKEASEENKTQIFTSALTIAECANVTGTEATNEEIRRFFENRAITILNADRLICEHARELQRTTHRDLGKKLPVRDSIHLATALRARAEALLTYDYDDLNPLSGRFSASDGTKLAIREPYWEGPRKMPGFE